MEGDGRPDFWPPLWARTIACRFNFCFAMRTNVAFWDALMPLAEPAAAGKRWPSCVGPTPNPGDVGRVEPRKLVDFQASVGRQVLKQTGASTVLVVFRAGIRMWLRSTSGSNSENVARLVVRSIQTRLPRRLRSAPYLQQECPRRS